MLLIPLLRVMQLAGQAVPLTKEVTGGIVRPGGKEVARIADKYSDDATRDKVQVSLGASILSPCPEPQSVCSHSIAPCIHYTNTVLGELLQGHVELLLFYKGCCQLEASCLWSTFLRVICVIQGGVESTF